VDDDDVAHDSDTQWLWRAIQTSDRGQKIQFTGQCEPQKNAECVLEAFELFFDQHVIDNIVSETNRYAEYCIQSTVLKPRSRMRSWQPVTSDELYVVPGLIMLMGIVQKPTLIYYFSRDAIYPQTMTQHI
jgi:hypothetical protein